MCLNNFTSSNELGNLQKSPVFGKSFDELFLVPENLTKVQVLPLQIVKNQRFAANLDTNIKFVRNEIQSFRIEFDKMRRYSGGILVDDRDKERGYSTVCTCGVRRLNGDIDKSPVGVVLGKESKKIFFNGLMKCGSVWRCPVCSFKITNHRRDEIYYMSSEWMRSGGKISFLTLTVRHKLRDGLKNSLDKLLSEFRKLQNTKLYKFLENEHDIYGFVKTTEITYGESNGWHPHLHLLVFHKSKDFESLHRDFIRFWCKRKAVDALQKSQRAKIVYSDVGITDYVTKWDMSKEMTGSILKDTKSGERYTPFSMLRCLALNKFECPEESALKEVLDYKFREYCKATKGKHFISVSKKLKAFFKERSGDEMKTDEEILQDEKVDTILFKIDIDLWDFFVKDKSVLPSYLLNAYENGGIKYVLEFFSFCGYRVKYDVNSGIIFPIFEDIKEVIHPFSIVYVRDNRSHKWEIRKFCKLAPKGIFVYKNQNEVDLDGSSEYFQEYTFYNPFENI